MQFRSYWKTVLQSLYTGVFVTRVMEYIALALYLHIQVINCFALARRFFQTSNHLFISVMVRRCFNNRMLTPGVINILSFFLVP